MFSLLGWEWPVFWCCLWTGPSRNLPKEGQTCAGERELYPFFQARYFVGFSTMIWYWWSVPMYPKPCARPNPVRLGLAGDCGCQLGLHKRHGPPRGPRWHQVHACMGRCPNCWRRKGGGSAPPLGFFCMGRDGGSRKEVRDLPPHRPSHLLAPQTPRSRIGAYCVFLLFTYSYFVAHKPAEQVNFSVPNPFMLFWETKRSPGIDAFSYFFMRIVILDAYS